MYFFCLEVFSSILGLIKHSIKIGVSQNDFRSFGGQIGRFSELRRAINGDSRFWFARQRGGKAMRLTSL